MKAQRKRMIGFNRPSLTPNRPKASKVEFVGKGKKRKQLPISKKKQT